MANEFRDIGRDIKDAVLDAVESGDFSQLNSRITRSVGEAIDEVNERLGCRGSGGTGSFEGQGRWNGTVKSDPCPGYSEERRRQNAQTRPQGQTQTRPQPAQNRQELQLYAQKPKGSLSGLLFTIFGAVFLGAFSLALLASVIAFSVKAAWGAGFWVTCGILGALTVGSGAMLSIGQKLLGRVRLFKKYVAALRGKHYCDIRDLAAKLGKKERQVVRELRGMIDRGMFPQGHIDDEEKTLLLTDSLYDQYRDLKRQREELASQPPETPEQALYRETAEQGQRYLEVIRRANDAIPGEVVSQKLYRLEDIVRKIFEQVKQHPEQIPELRRFLDYYMPITLKLVETYQELDSHPVAGQNILKSKEEIEKTLDTINQAFENLFDSLFEHTAVDITSDITVLKNMLKQEGLTEKDFTS